jgi:hypothetical protein
MSDKNERSVASAGSQEPVAWWFKCDDYESATLLKEHADAMAAPYGTTPIPLYCSPALTDRERDAIGVAIQCVEAARAQRHPEDESRDLLWETTCTLRRLFDRTT